MGRARGYDAAHEATSGNHSRFDAVLGARRGSASAQATRDAEEVQARDHAITKMIAALNLSSGNGTAVDLLVTAHRSGRTITGTPEYEKLCMDLIPTMAWWEPENVSGFRDLTTVAAHGDPMYWPGLTDPAVDALGAHLQATSDECEAGNVSKVFHAQIMTAALRTHASSLEQYERLAPVLKGLASLLHHLPPHSTGASAAQTMAEILRVAPTQALAGPLQSLVQAFGRRIQDGKSSAEERVVLRQMIEDQILSGQQVEALRPIKDAL